MCHICHVLLLILTGAQCLQEDSVFDLLKIFPVKVFGHLTR